MKLVAVFCLSLAIVVQKVNGDGKCEASLCKIENNCRCSSTNGPLKLEETPQLIVLAFVDAARSDLYRERWSPLVEPRQNPDGEFIGATFYVPHEFSDYMIVHDLAATGFEIGVHSVSNNPLQSYWRGASQSLLEKEFGSGRKIISKFANIPEDMITGSLVPQLQLAGDKSISAFVSQGFAYDNSWPASDNFYPYTLDYASTQNCDIGADCPKKSHKGFWIAPIVDLRNDVGDLCATLAGCFGVRNNHTAKEIADWLVDHVQHVKKTNRAPITLIVEENLFISVKESWDGLQNAFDTLQKDKEIFFVSQSRVIEWTKNPVPLSEFTTGNREVKTVCNKDTCTRKTLDGEIRYMVTCVPCPKIYPWLDNPEGN